MLKKVIFGLLGVSALGTIIGYFTIYPKLAIVSGYAARMTCTCTFAQGRDQQDVEQTDLAFSPVNLASTKVDRVKKQVVSSVFGLSKKKAVYREGFGCILLKGKDDYNIKFPQSKTVFKGNFQFNEGATKEVDFAKLALVQDYIFDPVLQTRACLILHKDSIIYEKYATNFSPQSPLLGWSMTKSVISTLFGIMKQEGRITLDEDHLFEDWNEDGRSEITIWDLLNQQSGLDWEENYDDISDVTTMLYNQDNILADCVDNKLAYMPGSQYYYSSGTTNLLSGLLRNKINDDHKYWTFPKRKLFDPLGMTTAFIEPDESGTFVGSSYMYASARDWLKYGKLYLNEGEWEGIQIVSKDWVVKSGTATDVSNGGYGMQFWQNQGGDFPDCPSDMYYADGYQGQRIYIIPSKDLVVVRFGLVNMSDNTFIKKILEAVEG